MTKRVELTTTPVQIDKWTIDQAKSLVNSTQGF